MVRSTSPFIHRFKSPRCGTQQSCETNWTCSTLGSF